MSGPVSASHSADSPWVGLTVDEVTAKARDENFPVATRLISRRHREHLLAIYAFARLVDDVGDAYDGDRLAALDELDREVTRAFSGTATLPVFVRLQPSISACRFVDKPFRDLIQANRQDQTKTRYETFDELVAYCTLSANPVGRLVLRVFDEDTAERINWSDDVCTALQIVEHLQDVQEDARAGRVYLPLVDLAAEGCTTSELTGATASPSLRRVIAHEAGRARTLLGSAQPLARSLRGRPSWAIAGFAGGGLAALDAIADAGYDVLAHRCRPRGRQVLRHAWQTRRGRRIEERG